MMMCKGSEYLFHVLGRVDRDSTAKLIDTKNLLKKSDEEMLSFIKNANKESLKLLWVPLQTLDEYRLSLKRGRNKRSLAPVIVEGLAENEVIKEEIPMVEHNTVFWMVEGINRHPRSFLYLFFKENASVTRKLLKNLPVNLSYVWNKQGCREGTMLTSFSGHIGSDQFLDQQNQQFLGAIILPNTINDESKEVAMLSESLPKLLETIAGRRGTSKMKAAQLFFQANLAYNFKSIKETGQPNKYLKKLPDAIPSNFSEQQQRDIIALTEANSFDKEDLLKITSKNGSDEDDLPLPTWMIIIGIAAVVVVILLIHRFFIATKVKQTKSAQRKKSVRKRKQSL